MREELGVKPVQVELAGLRLHVREQWRGPAIENHPLGGDKETHPVERVARKRRERANLEVAVAIQPATGPRRWGVTAFSWRTDPCPARYSARRTANPCREGAPDARGVAISGEPGA